jgi:hypothetical protein
LDFVLFTIDSQGREEPMGETASVQYTPPKTQQNRNKRAKVKKS